MLTAMLPKHLLFQLVDNVPYEYQMHRSTAGARRGPLIDPKNAYAKGQKVADLRENKWVILWDVAVCEETS